MSEEESHQGKFIIEPCGAQIPKRTFIKDQDTYFLFCFPKW